MSDKIKYVLDLDNLSKFIFEDSSTKRDSESEISEIYVLDENTNEMVMNSKQLRELKGGDTTPQATIKYDMIKMFIDTMLGLDVSEDSMWTFGEALIFNTMADYGFIKEVKG